MLEQIVVGQAYYVDPSYTDAITGQTHSITGEELFFGVNAFDVLRDAVAVLQSGNSLFINGLSSDSITVPETVSLYLTNSTAPLLRIGQDSASASYSGDIVTVISGSTFGSENGWLVGRLGTINGDVSILIDNSVLGNGWPTGRSTPQLRLAESCMFGADTETISVTIRDSVLKEDISLLHESGIGSKTKPGTVILTMERVTAPDDKWFWITNRTTQGVAYADVIFNIADSTFGNNGTMALSVAYDLADPDLFRGNVTYNISNDFFSGRLCPVTTWSPSYPYSGGHAGVFTVNITGGSSCIEAVSGFDAVNIAAGASLFTDDILGNKTVTISGELHAPSFSSGTEVHLLSGGTISGLVDLSADTVIATVEAGTLIDFDISGRHRTGSDADAQIKDLALFKNIPDFVLSVSVLQESGTYTLATGASTFDKTITVRDALGGSTIGTLDVGQKTEFLGQTYELSLSASGTLRLSVRKKEKDVPASVEGLTVRSGQSFAVSTSQTATGTTVSRGGEFLVSSGGTAENTKVDFGGSMTVNRDGTVEGVTVDSLGRLDVYSGGTATEILENGGFVSVSYGANVTFVPNVISGMRLSRGSATVHAGTTATDIKLTYGGSMHVCSGGIADGMSVNDGGGMTVSRGGTATNATVDFGGRLNLYSSGTATNATVNSGGVVEVLNTGSAINATVQSGGLLRVTGGGAAVNIAAASGALFDFSVTSNSYIQGTSNGSAFEIRDAVVSGFTLNDCSLGICSGVAAEDTVVSAAGALNISLGGKADRVAVNAGGRMVVSSGGTMTGPMTFEKEADVSACEGAALNFDLTQTEAGAVALVNDISRIKGAPLYTLTVDGTQGDGIYKLADGAAGFDKTISVANTAGGSLGTLAVGETLQVGTVSYTLNLTDSVLSVTVSGNPPEPQPGTALPFFTGDFNGDLFDTLAVQKDSTVTIYQNGEPWGIGLTLDPGWTVVGTGDFSGDGLEDFLRVNTEGYVVGEMSNGNGTFTPQVLNLKNAGWDILGTGDFNGNGTDDVLIANPTGASETVGLLGYWESGVSWTLINGYSPEWECVSTGDFNGDGKCDMLWKNSFDGDGGLTYNAYCTWIVDNPVDWRMVSVANPDEWNFLCSGDFDGNGSHDIAMINDVGVVGIWGVNDGYLSSWSILSAVTSEWQLAGVADFNADGTDDIAWSNMDTGLTGYWQINNKELTTWANIAVVG